MPYFPPSIKIANEWKSENIYSVQGKPMHFQPKISLAELGPGVRLYFYIIRVFMCNFFLATLLAIPSLIFCSAAGDALNEENAGGLILRDPLNVYKMSIASISTVNNTVLPIKDSAGKSIGSVFGTRLKSFSIST